MDKDYYLKPTSYIDWDRAEVKDKGRELTETCKNDKEKAKAIFYFVRDGVRYQVEEDPPRPEYYKASSTLDRGYGFCIPKAILMAALSRAVDIPSRLHFADLRNHQVPPDLMEKLETDMFIYHSYTEIYLNERWIKAAPIFNIELCEKFGFLPVEFSGKGDAMLHPRDKEGRLHFDYVRDHGTYPDFPHQEVMEAFRKAYPSWIED